MKLCPHCHGRAGFLPGEIDMLCPVCQGAGRVAEPRSAWTRHRPAETGFYWVRLAGGVPVPAWWDGSNRLLVMPGHTLAVSEVDFDQREVEFWPERLEEPVP